jgi:hypothetical protein
VSRIVPVRRKAERSVITALPKPGEPSSLDTIARTLGPGANFLVVAGWLLQIVALLSSSRDVSLVSIISAVVCMVLAVVGVSGGVAARRGSLVGMLAVALLFVGFLGSGVQLALNIGQSAATQITIVVGWVVALTWFVTAKGTRLRGGRLPAVVLAGLYLVLAALWTRSYVPYFDVFTVLTEGAQGLLSGHNPYAMTFSNLYTPEDVARFYGPNFLVDGRIPYGYPYPPITLFLSMPGHLLGDVRLAGVVWTALAFLALSWFGKRPSKLVIAALLVAGPGAIFIIQGWTEMLIVPLIVFFVLAVERGKLMAAAVILGALFVSKQYFLVAAPALWLLRPYATKQRVIAFVSTALVFVLPWAVADPGAMYRALVGFQAAPPLRVDSLSITVWLAQVAAVPDGALLRLLPLLGGFAVALTMALLVPAGLARFLVSVSLALFATVILSKQGFFNYYYLVAQLLIVAAYVQSWHSPTVHAAEPVNPAAGTG